LRNRGFAKESAGRLVQKINLLPNTTPALRATPRLRREFDNHTLKNVGFSLVERE